tara:strand:- start:2342 stop:2770 length:429 start_codon:yes stop_codon:yes gene_type:complete
MEKKLWQFKKTVLPQHADHAGVLWHGTYINWLEEARIDSLNNVGLRYIDLLKRGLEMPVYNLQIRYLVPIKIGQDIIIKSSYDINKSPRIKLNSGFFCKNEICYTKVSLDLVLIDRDSFKVVRKRPKFMDIYFENLVKDRIK